MEAAAEPTAADMKSAAAPAKSTTTAGASKAHCIG
jgi:hypothetical protein